MGRKKQEEEQNNPEYGKSVSKCVFLRRIRFNATGLGSYSPDVKIYNQCGIESW